MSPAEIKEMWERKAGVMLRRPGFGRSGGQAWVHMEGGYACAVEHEDRSTPADQPVADGGGGAAPHPGQLMLASLGAGLAMGYRTWGAWLEVAIDAVDVEATCEYDARGQMGVAPGVAVGWQRIVFVVRITSAATEEAVRRVVELADRLNPMLANLSPQIDRVHHLMVVTPGGAFAGAAGAAGAERSVPPFVTPGK